MTLPLTVSSITISTSFTVARVFLHILGLELISISQGDKSSPNMKSAPYNSNALYEDKYKLDLIDTPTFVTCNKAKHY